MATEHDTIVTELKLRGQAQYVAGVRNAARSQEQFDASSQRLERRAKTSSSAWGALGAGVMKYGKASVVGFGAAAGAAAYVGVQLDATRESNQAALGAMLKSPRAAGKLSDALEKMARSAEFAHEGVADFYPAARLLTGAGFNPKKTIRMARAIGDVAEVAGTGGEGMYSLARAFSQIKGKGVLQAEELGQVQDATDGLIGRGQLLNVLTEKQRKLFSQGKLPAEDGIAALTEVAEDFRPAAVEMGDTFSGQLATMQENAKYTAGILFQPLFDVMEQKLFPKLNEIGTSIQDWAQKGGGKDLFGGLTDNIKEFAANPMFGQALAVLGDSWDDFMTELKPAIPWLLKFDKIAGKIFGYALVGGILALSGALKVAAFIMRATGSAARWLGGASVWLEKKFNVLKESGVVTWLVGAFGTLKGVAGGIADLFMGIATAVKNSFGGMVDFFKGEVNDLIGIINSAINAYNAIPIAPNIGKIDTIAILPDVSHIPAEKRQHGGPVRAHSPYVVGEKGPELFIPNIGGNIRPNLGGMTIVVQSLLDGRLVAQNTAKHNFSEMARR